VELTLGGCRRRLTGCRTCDYQRAGFDSSCLRIPRHASSYFVQSSVFKFLIRPNALSPVTKITPNAIAWAAIIRSKPPGNCPCLSSSVRSRPYSRAAAESQATRATVKRNCSSAVRSGAGGPSLRVWFLQGWVFHFLTFLEKSAKCFERSYGFFGGGSSVRRPLAWSWTWAGRGTAPTGS